MFAADDHLAEAQRALADKHGGDRTAGLDAGRVASLAAAVAPGLAVDTDRLEERLRAGDSLAEALTNPPSACINVCQ